MSKRNKINYIFLELELIMIQKVKILKFILFNQFIIINLAFLP